MSSLSQNMIILHSVPSVHSSTVTNILHCWSFSTRVLGTTKLQVNAFLFGECLDLLVLSLWWCINVEGFFVCSWKVLCVFLLFGFGWKLRISELHHCCMIFRLQQSEGVEICMWHQWTFIHVHLAWVCLTCSVLSTLTISADQVLSGCLVIFRKHVAGLNIWTEPVDCKINNLPCQWNHWRYPGLSHDRLTVPLLLPFLFYHLTLLSTIFFFQCNYLYVFLEQFFCPWYP